MNQQRRKAITAIVAQIDTLREALDALRGQEQDAFDSLPESIQMGSQGEKMGEAIEALDEAVNGLEQATDTAREAIAL